MSLKSFEDLECWKAARELRIFVSQNIISKFPIDEKYALTSQLKRSSRSVSDNIAEGFGRGGNLEFIQFLEISHGSACECQSQLYRIVDRKYIPEGKFTELNNLCEEIKKITISLIHYLSSSENKGIKYSLRKK